tara:strand:- start:256 stop:459 length:204 start_codon:yes stop_codon:yes gene_type:complete
MRLPKYTHIYPFVDSFFSLKKLLSSNDFIKKKKKKKPRLNDRETKTLYKASRQRSRHTMPVVGLEEQ